MGSHAYDVLQSVTDDDLSNVAFPFMTPCNLCDLRAVDEITEEPDAPGLALQRSKPQLSIFRRPFSLPKSSFGPTNQTARNCLSRRKST